jgi:hypothetical protein
MNSRPVEQEMMKYFFGSKFRVRLFDILTAFACTEYDKQNFP